MIPQSQLVSGEAIINASKELRIQGKNIAIDGRVQTANIGGGRVILQGDNNKNINGIYLGAAADKAVLRDITIENFRRNGVTIFGVGSVNGQGATLERLHVIDNDQLAYCF